MSVRYLEQLRITNIGDTIEVDTGIPVIGIVYRTQYIGTRNLIVEYFVKFSSPLVF